MSAGFCARGAPLGISEATTTAFPVAHYMPVAGTTSPQGALALSSAACRRPTWHHSCTRPRVRWTGGNGSLAVLRTQHLFPKSLGFSPYHSVCCPRRVYICHLHRAVSHIPVAVPARLESIDRARSGYSQSLSHACKSFSKRGTSAKFHYPIRRPASAFVGAHALNCHPACHPALHHPTLNHSLVLSSLR